LTQPPASEVRNSIKELETASEIKNKHKNLVTASEIRNSIRKFTQHKRLETA